MISLANLQTRQWESADSANAHASSRLPVPHLQHEGVFWALSHPVTPEQRVQPHSAGRVAYFTGFKCAQEQDETRRAMPDPL